MADAMLNPDPAGPVTTSIPGLTFAYRFRDGAAERLGGADALRALHEPGGWVWLHLGLAEPGARDFIAQLDAVPERGRSILLSADEHLRLEPVAGGVAGVFADFLREAEGEGQTFGRLRFVLTDTLVVSGRRDALGGVARTLDAIDAGQRFPHAVALLESIVGHFADAVGQMTEELAETLNAIEDRVLDQQPSDERRSLAPVRRTAVRLHRQLASLRLLFRRWSIPTTDELPSRVGDAAGRLAQRLDGLDQEIVSLQDRARLLQDEIGAKLASETNRHLFVLTLVTIFILPPTLVVGVFGMNFTDLPFTGKPLGYIAALAVAITASTLVYGLLRWLKVLR